MDRDRAAYLGFLLTCLALALLWGGRPAGPAQAASGAFLGSLLAWALCLLVVLAPDAARDAWCRQPGHRCEDFLAAALLMYGWLIGVASAGVAALVAAGRCAVAWLAPSP